jgi:hypothetical protein
MSNATYFDQECPTCGRRLNVRVAYLGRQIVCRHCQARFEACDPTSAEYPPSQSGIALLNRANELINTVDSQIISAQPARPR